MVKDIFANLNAAVANTMSNDIKMIDIDELHSSEDNFFEIERIEEFAETILGQGGVKENLIVTPLPTGGYEIISGHRRTAAVRYLLNKGEIVQRVLPCLVQNFKSDDDKMLNLVFMNVTARRLSDAELWTSYEKVDAILKKKKEAGEKFGKIRDTLAGYLGVSSSQIGKLQNIEKYATDKVKEAVSNGSISISTANQIARLDEKEQEAIVDTQDISKIKTKDVKDQIVNSKKVDTSVKFSDASNSKKVDTSVKFPDVSNSEKVDTSVKFPDVSNSEKVDTSVKFPDVSNSEKVDTNVNFPNVSNPEKVDTNVNYPEFGNSKKVDTNVNFPNNGSAKKTDKLILTGVYKDLLDRITERYNEESQRQYTPVEMLELIISQYTLQNCEDLMPTSEE